MIFLTYWFFIFAAIFFVIYWLIPASRLRWAWLLIGCIIFHTHFAGPAGVLPIVFLGLISYLAGLSRNSLYCTIGIILNVLALVFYKYTKFLCEGFLGAIHVDWGKSAYTIVNPLLPEAPPLAISFFVFEFVHYLYDVRKGTNPIRNPFDFCSFAIFWPSIVAGPVKRYEQFIPAFHHGIHLVNPQDAAQGMLRVAVGLVKKIIADNLTLYINHYQARFAELSLEERWLFLIFISFRILLDFSGYSDMAIGFARMMGIQLPENFNWPYLARNLADFWHRWHISLSTWIRDYVYIPLGGNQHGVTRKIMNGLIAFALCGLWHGAAWHFIFWGIYHGVGLAIAANYKHFLKPLRPSLNKIPFEKKWIALPLIFLSWSVTMLHVMIGWLFFFYPVGEAWLKTRLLFGLE